MCAPGRRADAVRRRPVAAVEALRPASLAMALGLAVASMPAAADATRASPESDRPPATFALPPSEDYRIGVGDELEVVVDGSPELSRRVVVRPDGFVTLPLVDDVRAAGLAPEELSADLHRRLARMFVDPAVGVVVTRIGSAANQVRVIGGAAEPRTIPFRRGLRVADVLAEIGGLSPRADGNAAVLVRGSERIPLRLDDLLDGVDVGADQPLAPGDVIVVPEGVFSGEWRRQVSVGVGTTFTSNYDLAPSGEEDPALITGITPQIEIAGKGARFEGALAAALTAQYVALSNDGPGLVPNLLGASRTELVRDTAYLDAAASIAELQLSTGSATSATAGNDLNLTLVQSYQLSPSLVTRLRDLAYVQTRYTLAGIVAGEDEGESGGRETSTTNELSDTLTNSLEVRIANPPEQRGRLQWQSAGYATLTRRFEDSDVRSAGLTGSPRYNLTRALSVVGVAGYSALETGEEALSGPDVAAGFGYEPSPAVSVRALAGWRLENPQADAVLRWDIGPSSRLVAHYSDGVGVGQTMLVESLSDLAYDPETRQFVDRETTLPFAPSMRGVDLENGLTRTQHASATLSHLRGSTKLSVSGYYTSQESIDDGGSGAGGDADGDAGATDQTSWGVSVGLERPLTATMRLASFLSFVQTDREGGGEDGGDRDGGGGVATGLFEDVVAGIGLTYDITDRAEIGVGYRLQRRFAEEDDDSFSEHVVSVGLTRRF